jgi:hypothetical protein
MCAKESNDMQLEANGFAFYLTHCDLFEIAKWGHGQADQSKTALPGTYVSNIPVASFLII